MHMSRKNDARVAFRCSVAPEEAAAKLRLRGRMHDCAVRDTSIGGFSIHVPPKLAKKLQKNNRFELMYKGETWRVEVRFTYSECSDYTVVGLHRAEDLTKFKSPSVWWAGLQRPDSNVVDPAFLAVLVVAFLLACVCLPGIGDGLGTAPKVRKGLNSAYKALTNPAK